MHDVIAAITTAPWSTSTSCPSMLIVTGLPPGGSYMEVRRADADGPLLFEGTVAPGTSRRWRVARPVWIRVGWTPSLQVRVSGRAVRLSGGTANFVVSRSGARPA